MHVEPGMGKTLEYKLVFPRVLKFMMRIEEGNGKITLEYKLVFH